MKCGQAGGQALVQKRGSVWMAAIGQAGGLATLKKYGVSHMTTIGRKGGQTTLQRHGVQFYKRLAKYKRFLDEAKWNEDVEIDIADVVF